MRVVDGVLEQLLEAIQNFIQDINLSEKEENTQHNTCQLLNPLICPTSNGTNTKQTNGPFKGHQIFKRTKKYFIIIKVILR